MARRSRIVAVAPVETPATPAPLMQPSRWLRVAEAATYIASTESFIRSLVAGKKVPFIVSGKRFIFDRKDLDSFMESEKQKVA
jgi:excisionase family DNA binding protein